jgi:hypothetical protein
VVEFYRPDVRSVTDPITWHHAFYEQGFTGKVLDQQVVLVDGQRRNPQATPSPSRAFASSRVSTHSSAKPGVPNTMQIAKSTTIDID